SHLLSLLSLLPRDDWLPGRMACYFAELPRDLLFPKTSIFHCDNDLIRFDSLLEEKSHLYGCVNPIDLLILRGNGQSIDWSNNDEVQRVYSQH
ncbi:hypothetical protein PMAYCL1PPCAC_33225, partial [Pristionchus mayeri]